jgi:branched-chain amino acid transport system substrate-binding protein
MDVKSSLKSLSRRHALGAGAAAVAVLATQHSAFAQSSAAAEEYTLGVILSSTGPLSVLGQLAVKGAQLRVEQINAAGGINGHKLRLDIFDNKSDPQATVSGARGLLSKKIVGLIGPESTALGTGVIPLVNAAKIPNISLQGGIDLTGEHGYVFGVQITGSVVVKATINHMKARGIKKIGYLSTSDALGQAGDRFGLPLFQEAGIEIVGGKQTIDPAGSDYATQLAAVRSAGAESVFLWGTGAPAIVAAKGFKAQRMPGNLYLLNLTIAQITAMGDAVDVVLVSQTKANVHDQLPADDPIAPRLKPFVDAAIKANVPIDTFSSAGYGAVVVFEDAIRKVGPDPQKIFQLWNSGYEPPTTVARMKWDSAVHLGFNPLDAVITAVDPKTMKFRIAK